MNRYKRDVIGQDNVSQFFGHSALYGRVNTSSLLFVQLQTAEVDGKLIVFIHDDDIKFLLFRWNTVVLLSRTRPVFSQSFFRIPESGNRLGNFTYSGLGCQLMNKYIDIYSQKE
jgi:hypothetical protein